MFQDLMQNIDSWEKDFFKDQSQLLEEYNANLRRWNTAETCINRRFADVPQAWLDEIERIKDRQNEILSQLSDDLYRDESGFLYQEVPPLQNKEGFSFFRGDFKALFNENIPDNRFLQPYYACEVNREHWETAGVRRVIVILTGCTQVFVGDVVLTRQELIEVFKVAENEGIGAVISLISCKKIFGNATRQVNVEW